MTLKLRRFKLSVFFINKENKIFLIIWLIINSKSFIYKIISFRILFILILGNYKSRKSSFFYSSVIAIISLFFFIINIINKILNKIYFKAI